MMLSSNFGLFWGHTAEWWTSVSALGTWAAVMVAFIATGSSWAVRWADKRRRRRARLSQLSAPLLELYAYCRASIRAHHKFPNAPQGIRVHTDVTKVLQELRAAVAATDPLKREEENALVLILLFLSGLEGVSILDEDRSRELLKYTSGLLKRTELKLDHPDPAEDESLDRLLSGGPK